MSVKTLTQLQNEQVPFGQYGPTYFNLETGITPEIDESVYITGTIDCIHKVTVEKGAFFGHDVMLLTGSHDPNLKGEDRKAASGGGPILIKKGAWIASRATLIGPLVIGENAVVGAGAVVAKDVPDNAVVVGNPAKVIRLV